MEGMGQGTMDHGPSWTHTISQQFTLCRKVALIPSEGSANAVILLCRITLLPLRLMSSPLSAWPYSKIQAVFILSHFLVFLLVLWDLE